jgi:ubiquinone/menaquinone biosynthesis C-methylase UbiE
MINTKEVESPFEEYSFEYDKWFDDHPFAFQSELQAVKKFMPANSKGVEIGVGTGRFASQLNISIGVEPSESMASIARSGGIEVLKAYAKHLPFDADHFDFALMITTLCFVEDSEKALKEIIRILKPGGNLILGIIDRETKLGKKYESMKKSNKFYRDARFYSAEEAIILINETGFVYQQACQTIFSNPETMTSPDPVHDGYGEGAFVVINSIKP